MPDNTPLRRLGHADPRGFRVLSDAGVAYADGAEERLAGIVAEAMDLSSHSEELEHAAEDWGTFYSLSPARANALRGLALTPTMTVLEVGCGNGPVTRYLGETCGTVDSLEPMPDRAAVASLRTRDLDSVEVFVGTIEDVPAVPTYDVVVVIGVLEYIGQGLAARGPYLDFLRACHAVLRDEGTLVLAIENALGVKYLAGAAEDHTNRPFDSLEGYALWSPARTFSRRQLEALLTEAGFASTEVLGAFPDYKLPRAVMSDKAFREDAQLSTTLPRFPSRDYLVPRLNLADEGLMWRTLVGAGVGEHFSNSFITLAAKSSSSPPLWPEDRYGVLFSDSRRVGYAVRADIVESTDGLAFVRSALYPTVPEPAVVGLRHVVIDREPLVRGTELVYVLAYEPERRAELLRQWLQMLPDTAEYAPVDLVPHNLLLTPEGSLRSIDQEWAVRGYRRSSIVVRGLFLAAQMMAQITRPESLAPWRTVEDALHGLAQEAGFELDETSWRDFIEDEAAFQAAVTHATDDRDAFREQAALDLAAMPKTTLAMVRGGDRLDLQWARAGAALSSHGFSLDGIDEQIRGLRERLDSAAEALAAQVRQAEAVDRERAVAMEHLERVQRDLEHVLRRSLFGTFVRTRRWWSRRRADRADG